MVNEPKQEDDIKEEWIIDSVSRQNVINNLGYLYDIKESNIQIVFGNKEIQKFKIKWKVKLEINNFDGTVNNMVLEDVSYIKIIITNCISITVEKIKVFDFMMKSKATFQTKSSYLNLIRKY